MKAELRQKFIDIAALNIEIDKDLTNFSTMRLRARGTLISVESEDALLEFCKRAKELGLSYRVLGLAANQLLPERSNQPYLRLRFPFEKSVFESPRAVYRLPASVPLNQLTSHAIKHGLKGWEVFTGIPATLGGATFMNAGTNLGEIGSLVRKVWLCGPDGIRIVETSPKDFVYRGNNFVRSKEVIYSVELTHFGYDEQISDKIRDYLSFRSKTQPLSHATCGCVFKNLQGATTCRAGQYVDIMGLKGLAYKNLKISGIHGNFIENRGGAVLDDVLELIALINEETRMHFGITFEPEVQIWHG